MVQRFKFQRSAMERSGTSCIQGPSFVAVSPSLPLPRVNVVTLYVPQPLSTVYERTDTLTRCSVRVLVGLLGNPQENAIRRRGGWS